MYQEPKYYHEKAAARKHWVKSDVSWHPETKRRTLKAAKIFFAIILVLFGTLSILVKYEVF